MIAMAEKMQAIMKTKPAYGAELVEVDVPKPGPGEVSSRYSQRASVGLIYISTSGTSGHRAG